MWTVEKQSRIHIPRWCTARTTELGPRIQKTHPNERWTRPPFTRVQFEALRRIDPGMPADEVRRRVRATDYPPYGPYVELHGFKFKLAKDPV